MAIFGFQPINKTVKIKKLRIETKANALNLRINRYIEYAYISIQRNQNNVHLGPFRYSSM